MRREREEQRLMPYFMTGVCLLSYLVLAVCAPSMHEWWHQHHAHDPHCAAHLQQHIVAADCSKPMAPTINVAVTQTSAPRVDAQPDEPEVLSGPCCFCQFGAIAQGHIVAERPLLSCSPRVSERIHLECRCSQRCVERVRVRGPPAVAV